MAAKAVTTNAKARNAESIGFMIILLFCTVTSLLQCVAVMTADVHHHNARLRDAASSYPIGAFRSWRAVDVHACIAANFRIPSRSVALEALASLPPVQPARGTLVHVTAVVCVCGLIWISFI